MKKIVCFLALIWSSLFLIAQEKQQENKAPFVIHDLSTKSLKVCPLYVIDGRNFKCGEQVYFDYDSISSHKLLRGQEAIDKYGKEGKRGVIVVELKEKVEWISLQEILLKMYADSCAPEKIIVRSDKLYAQSTPEYTIDRHEVIYFQNNLIREMNIVKGGSNGIRQKCFLVVQLTK